MMKGMELCESYFNEYGNELLESVLGDAKRLVACGLAGEGSQCFGFDDELSTDHDFCPCFSIWMSNMDYMKYGKALEDEYSKLPKEYKGYSCENVIDNKRFGPMRTEEFFLKTIGRMDPPMDNISWLKIPESALATACNGKVFVDYKGEFSSIRKRLMAFYPEDVRLKKIAARAVLMGQSGQYNLFRAIKRNDEIAVALSISEFIKSSLSMSFLLNKRYMPFYKWISKASEGLIINKKDISAITDSLKELTSLVQLVKEDNSLAFKKAFDLVEPVVYELRQELYLQGLSNNSSEFLSDHGHSIMSNIVDDNIRHIPPIADVGY